MVPAIKELLEAGVHFGHQKKRWNPKMKKFIFGERNGIYIIDLQKTLVNFGTAIEFIKDVAAKGKPVLFVGTKRQAQEIIEQEARKCGMFFINQRWLGGMLTNFFTIKRSIDKLRRFEKWQEDGTFEKLPKKEVNMIEKQMVQMDKILCGIKSMNVLPGAVFVVDTKKEYIAVHEAKKLGIPVVGIVDTNCDPENIDFVIPGNDDAIKAIKLICSRIADAVIEGRAIYDAKGGVKQEIPVSIPEAEMVPVSTEGEVVQEIPDTLIDNIEGEKNN